MWLMDFCVLRPLGVEFAAHESQILQAAIFLYNPSPTVIERDSVTRFVVSGFLSTTSLGLNRLPRKGFEFLKNIRGVVLYDFLVYSVPWSSLQI
jgi:hypothetical protein